ncbi:MAG: serine/threonine-protein kinase, partial [Planctomycetota bacterium]
LVKKLGEGAFGVVYLARHDLLDQEFAVKLLKPELCEDEDTRDRFLDEARALIRFSHANVVQLRHVGEQEGRLYLVMDLVRGQPLDEILRKTGPLPEARAVDIELQLLAGLEAAHAAGIVHRDLKPSNLIVEERSDGRDLVRILDFGLSKLSAVDGMAGAHRSVTGTIIGTLGSDVFAAGLVLHAMLQGHHPYPGESGIVVAAKLLRDAVPALDAKRAAKLSPSTRAALERAVERDRDARFGSAFAFAQALEGKGPPSDTSRVTTIEHARRELARAQARDAATAREARSKKKRSLAILAIVALLAAGGAFFAFGDRGASDGNGTDVAGGGPSGTTPVDPAPSEPPGPADPPPSEPTGPVDPPPSEPTEPVDPPPSEPTEPIDPPPSEPTEPVDPAPSEPTEPVDPAPTEPVDPAPSEPTLPEPTPPEPAPPEPTPPEPTPPEPVDPAPSVTGTPAELLALATSHAAAGRWSEASTHYRQILAAEPTDMDALRGAAESSLRDADALARRGRVDEALATLDLAVAWLTAAHGEYEQRSATDRAGMMLPQGFSRMYLAEAHTERARWFGLKGDAQARDRALKQAEADLGLAWQFLDRDGVNYWEFLLRRAQWHLLQGDWRQYLDDLAITTQTDNTEVPAKMWVAHAAGLRRAAEANLARRRPEQGRQLANQALAIIKKGIAWQRSQGLKFTRDQWLEAARVIFVNHLALDDATNRTAIHGLMKWYVSQAEESPAPTYEAEALAKSKLLTMKAALALVESQKLEQDGNGEGAAQQLEAARTWIGEAVQLREALATTGGELPAAFPFVVMAKTMRMLGKPQLAGRAADRAREALARNPE